VAHSLTALLDDLGDAERVGIESARLEHERVAACMDYSCQSRYLWLWPHVALVRDGAVRHHLV
jgi:hypothetical protein